MNTQFLLWSRVIRLVVLLALGGWLVSNATGLDYFFAAICAALIALTCYQLWASVQKGGH